MLIGIFIILFDLFLFNYHNTSMDQNKKIQDGYKYYSIHNKKYDDIMTSSSLTGSIITYLMFGLTPKDNRKWLEELSYGIPKDFKSELLEVPIATGILSIPFYKSLNKAHITVIDYSEDMLKECRNKARKLNINNIDFLSGDVAHLPFKDEAFDIVYSLYGFHVFPDKEIAFKETYRVLKKGGIFTGCFYIEGERRLSDFIINHIHVRKGLYTPPFETRGSVTSRLNSMYEIKHIEFNKCLVKFVCIKK